MFGMRFTSSKCKMVLLGRNLVSEINLITRLVISYRAVGYRLKFLGGWNMFCAWATQRVPQPTPFSEEGTD